MKIQFDILTKTRAIVLHYISGLSLDQIHVIPEGFNNHIAWNIAHLVVTQQLLHYKLSGKDCLVSDDLKKDQNLLTHLLKKNLMR